MYYYIKGTLQAVEENAVIIDNGGIAYRLSVSTNTMAELSGKKEVLLYTYLHVKEDGITLYGFYCIEEKKMFENLITVSGVGCKVALAVLSGMKLSDLAICIAEENALLLSRIKGIGKKTAERIILELKEKVAAEDAAERGGVFENKVIQDACSALMALGLKKNECVTAVKKAMEQGAQTAEEIISNALKVM